MTEVLKLSFFIALFTGLFFILLDVFNAPTLRAKKVIKTLTKRRNKRVKNLDIILDEISISISKYIYLSSVKERKLQILLTSANMNVSPKMYIAKVVIKTLSIAVFLPLSLYTIPLFAPFIIVGVIITYYNGVNEVEKIVKVKREQIEYDLLRFVSTIAEELKHSRNVLTILERYKINTTGALKDELDVTIADMKSGSQEKALTRLESRVSSPKLSEVVRGLLGVIRGDDNILYFQMLLHDLRQLELQRLKAEALKRPPKIRKYSMLMLVCMIMMYLSVMIMQVLNVMKDMF